MFHRILLQASIGGLIGSFFALSTVAMAQSPSQISSADPTPAVSTQPHIAGAAPVVASPSSPPLAVSGTLITTTPNTPAAAPASVSSSNFDAIQAKNPDLLMAPLHLGSVSLLFSKKDISIIEQLLELYDSSTNKPKQENTTPAGDDLNNLLKELTAKHTDTNAPAPVAVTLPNVYLASIVYYSPSHWSVWINDKKLVSTHNTPNSEFYVNRLSRTQAELIWKPQSLLDTGAKWRQLTSNGKNPLSGINIDESKGTITLILRPGQTFLPRSLAITEGLIKSVHAATATPDPNATH